MIRLQDSSVCCLNKVFLAFIVITFVVKDKNTNVRLPDVVYALTIKLCNQRLCELGFASSHSTYDSRVSMENLIRISGMPIQRLTIALIMSKQHTHFVTCRNFCRCFNRDFLRCGTIDINFCSSLLCFLNSFNIRNYFRGFFIIVTWDNVFQRIAMCNHLLFKYSFTRSIVEKNGKLRRQIFSLINLYLDFRNRFNQIVVSLFFGQVC